MANRKSPPPPTNAKLTVEQMRKGIARLERLISEVEAFDTTKLTKRWSTEQTALETNIEGVLTSVFGHDTVEFRRYSSAIHLDSGPVVMGWGEGPSDDGPEARQYVAEGKAQAILLLKEAIRWLNAEIGDASEADAGALSAHSVATRSNKVFIVHGHDEGARQTIARFIDNMGFEAIILSEQANQGRTIIEKIEAHGDVGFAIVLLTPDDVGGRDISSLRPRARQNVLLELGYFIARLGRARVCALAKGDLEIPTDFAGVVWEKLDDAGAWRIPLARELKAAGYAVDWNQVMG